MVDVIDAGVALQERQILMVPGYTEAAGDGAYYVTRYLGALPDNVDPARPASKKHRLAAQAYLVEQPAHSVVPAHYHDTNQYQVFLNGTATFGKQSIGPVTVHYASGHTPYGPIVTEGGVTYLTLRNCWDSGGKSMPQSRATLQPVKRRFRMVEDIDIPDPGTARGATQDALLPCEDDGLGVSRFTLGPNAASDLALPHAGTGRYAMVLAGTLTVKGETLGKASCLYIAEERTAAVAGPSGAVVIVMQFPPETVPPSAVAQQIHQA